MNQKLILFLILYFGLANASQFRGGIIQWRPVNASNFDGLIEFTHRMAWRRSASFYFHCDQNTIDNRQLIGGGQLYCSSGCSWYLGSLNYYCTDYSIAEDWSSGEKTWLANVGLQSSFQAYYQGCCWIGLRQGGGWWRLNVRGILTPRPDNGLINSSPVTAMTPIIRLQLGCPSTIHIPVQDADGDDIRCRWGSGYTECGYSYNCQGFSYGTLTGCALHYNGGGLTGLYALTIQVEDFISLHSTTAMSSVPMQFIISLFTSHLSCDSGKPQLVAETLPTGSCIPVPFGITFNFSIVASVNHVGIRIVEFPTVSIVGVTKSAVAMSTYNPLLYYTNVTWTPQLSQFGLHIFCFSAKDTNSLTSDQSCIVFLGGVQGPRALKNTVVPSGNLTLGKPVHLFSVEFDHQIFRPTIPNFINIYENKSNGLVDSINATSSRVSFPTPGSGGREINFTSNYTFQSGVGYYVLFDLGVAVGKSFCHQESEPITSKTFWSFTAEINECAKGLDDCGPLANCVDTLQGFNCVCIPGYSGDGYSCVDIDECSVATAVCPQYTWCLNNMGSYSCPCKFGVSSSGDCSLPPDPHPPRSLHARSTTSTTATIAWSSPQPQSFLPISQYSLSLADQLFGLPQINVTVNSTKLSYTFSGLEEFDLLKCDIVSVSSYGGISISASITLRTNVAAPSAAPRNLAAVATSSSMIFLSWSDPPAIDINGNVVFYFIFIREIYTGRNMSFHSFSRQLTAGPLHPNYAYSCKVAAFTTTFGPFTPTVTVSSGEAKPSAPPRNFTLTSITTFSASLSWEPPQFEQQNGRIRHYVIYLTDLTGIDGTVQLKSSTKNWVLNNLRPAFCYSVSVAACTIDVGPATVNAQFCLLTSAPSAPPQGVNGYPLNPTTFHLEWSPPSLHYQNGLIVSYSVNVTENETAAMFQVKTNQTTFRFLSLHPDYTYCCRIAANTIAEGPFSPNYCVRLHQGIPSAAPHNLMSVLPDPRSIVLSWDPPQPEDKNGKIIRYAIDVTRSNTGHNFQQFTSQTTVTITNLVPYTAYTCMIAASTVGGTGPFSSAYTVTTLEDKPSVTRNIAVSRVTNEPHTLLVTWTAPSILNGLLTNYTVYCAVANGGNLSVARETSVGPSFTFAKVNGLVPFTTYHCAVTASTSAGESDLSSTDFATTDESVPDDAPEMFRSTQVSVSSVTVLWSQPMIPNGIVTAYTLHYNSTDGVSNTRRTVNTFSTVTGLQEYTYYEFIVRASTRIGDGPTTSIIVQTKESYPTSAPENVRVITTSPTSLSLMWSPPTIADQNGVITHYSVILKDLQFDAHDIIVNPTTLSYVFTSLNEYNNYSCQIAAATSVGLGPYSQPIPLMTDQAAPSAPPQHLSGSGVSSSVINLSWSPPPVVDINGIVVQYTVRVTDNHTGRVTQFVALENRITVGSLTPYALYDCAVSAFTIASGPFSGILTVRTNPSAPTASPSQVSALVSSNTLILMWAAPSSEHINGVIHHYVAILTEMDASRSSTGAKYSLNASSTVVTFRNLHPYYYYKCSVAAYTVALGPVSESITIRLKEDAPAASPNNVIGTALSPEIIRFTWDPPPIQFQNGLIRSYMIKVMENETGVVTQHSTTMTQINLNSLHAYYVYELVVAAVTVASGPFSQPVTVQTHPDVPHGPIGYAQVPLTTSDTVMINWTPPKPEDQNGEIRYHINVTETDSRGSSFQLATASTSITISSLRPFTHYEVRIAAYTVVGDGPYSSPINVVTREAAPSSPPEDVTLAAIRPTAIRISWSPPPAKDQNGLIRQYRINITEVDTDTVTLRTSVSTYIVLFELHPFYTYECIVGAVTVTEGPYSDLMTITTPEDVPSGYPLEVTNTSTTARSAVISWDPPDEEDQNGLITSYTVKIVEAGTEETLQRISSTTSITATSLKPYTSYSVSVAASTSVGNGPFSISITLRTNQDVPTSPPLSINSRAHDPMTIHISWTVPVEANGIVIEYKVKLREVNTGQTSLLPTHSTSIEANTVHPAYTYEYSVAASTAVGYGPFSDLVNITTPEDAPSGPPQNAIVFNITARSVVISYSPPLAQERNGVVIQYKVELTNLDLGTRSQIETAGLQLLVQSLRPYTVYEITVTGRTAIGYGPFSEQQTFRTLESVPGSHPTNATGRAINSSHILLTWEAPPANLVHGVIREYRINVTEDSTGRMLHFTISAISRELLIGNLHPHYVYHCTIVAFTIEAGPYTDVIVVQTKEAAPSGPPLTFRAVSKDPRSASLFWAPPQLDLQNGILRHYVIIIKSVSGRETRTITAPANSSTLTGLQPHTLYEFSITAVTIAASPSSPIVSVKTSEDAPTGPPLSVQSSAINASLVYIQWDPPAADSHNGVIRRYHINISEVDTGKQEQRYTENLHITIGSLHPFYQYRYTVSAETITAGPPSLEGRIQMPEAAPSAPPTNIEAVKTTSTSFLLQWNSPPLDGRNGNIRRYILVVTEQSSDKVIDISTQNTEQLFESLHPYYNYTFSVAAVTISAGVFSKQQTVTTLEDRPGASPHNLTASVPDRCSTSIHVQWEALAEGEQNGLILGYTINIVESGSVISFTRVTNDNNFLVDALQPFTVYNCSVSAYTSVGNGPSTHLPVTTCEDVPSAPRMPRRSNVTSDSASLSWLPPARSNGVIRHYLLFFDEKDTGFNRTVLAHSNTNFVVGGLHPYYTYHLSIHAVTISTGPPSTVLILQTLQDAPSGYPIDSEAFAVTPNILSLEWDPPAEENQNGIIIDYFVNVTAVETSTAFSVVSGGSLSTTIPGLHPFYTYNYIIAAVTNVGRGPFSMSRSVQMPQDAPTAPPRNLTGDSINSTSIEIVWEEPKLSAQNGIISSYHIILTDLQSQKTKEYSRLGSHFDLVISSLHPYYNYQFSVAAGTVIGRGPLASFIPIQTKEDAPSGSPQKLNITSLNSMAVQLSWETLTVEQTNGIIRGYNIMVKSTQSDEKQTLNSTSNNIVIHNLHPYYTYDFLVAAVTVGIGPYTIGRSTLPQDIPTGVPKTMRVDSQSSSVISISWRPPVPEQQNGVITSYYIDVLEVQTGTTLKFQTHGSASFYIVNALHPYYTYNCSVAAFTIGLGPSAHASVLTHPDKPSDKPHNVSVSATSATTVLMKWSPPPDEHRNGIINSYTVHVADVDTGDEFQRSVNSLQVLITDLHPFNSYEFSVTAVTIIEGPFSEPMVLKMPEAAPSSPPHDSRATTTSSTSVTLAWYPPDPQEWNGEVVRYTVLYQLIGILGGIVNSTVGSVMSFSIPSSGQSLTNINDPVTVRLPLETETAVIEGLEEYSLYKFWVYFETSAGRSANSEWIQVETLSDVPSGPPVNMVATVLSAWRISVQWNAPLLSDRNGRIIGYHILVRNPDTTITTFANVSGDTHYFVAEGLNSFTNYEVSAAAKTILGVGPYTVHSNVKTQESVPSTPYGLSVRAKNSSSVFLSWMKPTKSNGIILEYQMNYFGYAPRKIIDNEQESIEVDIADGNNSLLVSSSELIAFITGLKTGLFYNFTVRARNVAGFSENSSTLQYNVPAVSVSAGAAIGSPSNIAVVVIAAAGWVLILLIAFFLGVYLCRRKGKSGASLIFRETPGARRGNDYEIFTNPVVADEEDQETDLKKGEWVECTLIGGGSSSFNASVDDSKKLDPTQLNSDDETEASVLVINC